MGSQATRKIRAAVLNEEINSIHLANRVFWRVQVHSHEAGVEYYRRQDRLEDIRRELCGLARARNSVDPLRHPRSSCQL